METLDREGYTAILWEGREYVPWGMVSDGRGKQVGYVDGDEKKGLCIRWPKPGAVDCKSLWTRQRHAVPGEKRDGNSGGAEGGRSA